MNERDPGGDTDARRLRGEERLVRGAILMVACHGSPRVTVAGLRFGEQVLDRSRKAALEAGVRVLARAALGGERVDVVVEAVT